MQKAVALILILFVTFNAAAQTDIKFKNISVEQGLSQSTVKSIYQDKRGYIWFGTRDGLNKYDGYKITIYKHDPHKKESISNNFITNIFEDSGGQLWIGTMEGLDRYDSERDIFLHFPLEGATIVRSVAEDSQKRLWVSTQTGLYLIDPVKNSFKLYQLDKKDPSSLVDARINRGIFDNSGQLWLATTEGIEIFNLKTGQFKHYTLNDGENRLSGNNVETIYIDRKGNIWIGTLGGGLALYDKENDSFKFFKHDASNNNSLVHNEILSLTEDEEGNLWIGTQNGGISIFDYTKHLFKTLRQDLNNVHSLTNNSIHSIYKDNQGNMWVGTWAGGVNYYSPYADKFISYQKILDFDNPNIYCVTGDEKGNIWIGKEGAGLISFDRKNNSFHHLKDDNDKEMMVDVIFGMINANSDTLALVYHRGGFAFFNKKTQKFTHFLPEPNNPYSLTGDTKTVVIKDSDNDYWIGAWGEGLHHYDKAKNRFTNYLNDPNDPHSLSDQVVFALCEDKEKNIWVGTEKGLNMLDRKTNKFTHYLYNHNDINSISHNTIHSLFTDSKGNIWAGTLGGLNLFDKKTNSFISYTEKDGLPNNAVNSILEDNNGNLWLGTNKGICKFNIEAKTFRSYYIQDGLQGNEFNRNGCYKAPDGTMFFAGTRGFSVFHPDSIITNPHIPSVEITSFQIFNKTINIGDKDSLLTKHVSRTRLITLPYSASVFAFEFAALNFSNSDENEYAYKMDGFDKSWVCSGTRRLATYTNLDPGEYIFRVKASNNDGVWNEEGTSVKVIITPPFWLTKWFRFSVIATVLLSGFIFYKRRINTINNQKKILEKKVALRTAQLSEANSDLKVAYEDVSQHKEEIEAQTEVLITINKDLSELNTELNSSIRAAESIQKTILTSGAFIKDHFPESFILYKPRDVVSGDFYWFNEIKDAIVLAAVDCTGHGVSGAIMSIHAYHLLNLAIFPYEEVLADEVLERLNKIVCSEFNRKLDEEETTMAGMDIALCVIDRDKKSLQYAGAISPLYILRDKEIIQVKGNRYPIGLISREEKKLFNKHEIELRKGDRVYLFSDGYADQMGGELGEEKFLYTRFRDLLIANCHVKMHDQCRILEETLNEWRGKTDQLDDIMVVGVEI